MSAFCNPTPFTEFRSPLHGNGLKSLSSFKEGDTVFTETPYCILQSLPNTNTALVCGNCHRFLGSASTQLSFLKGSINRIDLINCKTAADRLENDIIFSEIISCPDQCGVLYCSQSCQDHHWDERGHNRLCTGHVDEEAADHNPLIQFKIHAMSTNEIFLLVAEVFISIMQKTEKMMENSGLSLDDAWKIISSPLDNYVRQLWWDAAKCPEDSDPVAFPNSLKELVHDTWHMLDRVISMSEKGFSPFLSIEYMARTIGMFEQNNVGVRLENPLVSYIKELDPGTLTMKQICESVQLIVDNLPDAEDYMEDDEEEIEMDEGNNEKEEFPLVCSTDPFQTQLFDLINQHGVDNLFPPLDGTAFYINICKINHSCEPNVRVFYKSEDLGLIAEVVVLKDILPDQELVQSYIDETMETEDRQIALEDYGFKCHCSKCLNNS